MQRSVTRPAERTGSFGAVFRLLHSSRVRRRQRWVLEQAYQEFRATHSHCPDTLFDMHFLKGRGAEALSSRDAGALAYAWTRPFRYGDMRQRQRDVRRLIPLAESLFESLSVWETYGAVR